jgi:HK97 family phage major capsid protein
MAENLKRLLEQRASTWSEMQGILSDAEAASRDLTSEERAKWDAAEASLATASDDIDRLKRAADLEGRLSAPVADRHLDAPGAGRSEEREAQINDAFSAYMRNGVEGLSAEQRDIMAGRFETRANSVGTNSAGGYLVPSGYLEKITETLKAYGGILNIANVIHTETGNPLPWPSNDDTGNTGRLLSENTQLTETDPTIGQKTLNAWTYTSDSVLVSLQLLQDSVFDLDSWIPKKLGQRLGRAVATDLAVGNGSSKPTGIAYAPTAGKTGATGQTTSIIYDDIVDLAHSVDPAYRAGGNCRFVMNDASLGIIRKLKDSYGHPLWQPTVSASDPDYLLGYPVTVDQAIPAMAANAFSVLFGDFQAGYLVRQAMDVQVMRLAERYADYLQVGFFGFLRIDAKPDDAAAVKAYKNSAT